MEFKLPELGEHIESGDVVNVLVREGQVIAPNDGVIELETDKAVVEIPCPHGGKIAQILVKKGQTVRVGQPVVVVEAEGPSEETPTGPRATSQGTIGGPSASAAGALSPEPSLAAALTRAGKPPAAPTAQGATAQGATAQGATAQGATAQGATGGWPASAVKAAEEALPAGPESRRLARELGIDLRQVVGTGTRGRITPEDVRAAAQAAPAPVGTPPVATTVGPPVAPVTARQVPPGEAGQDAWGPVRRERMPKIRQTIAAQMARSAATIPHVTNFDDADVTELESLRKSVPAGYLGGNIKLTAMPFVMRAVALSLQRHAVLNASIDEEHQQIVYKQYVNLGVAVDTPRGLVVPAVRNADRMSVAEMARALATLSERARAAQFAVEELRGGTFTISNLGAVGGTYSTPIINHPEVAILLLGRSRWLPVVRDGKIEPRLLMPLSLSYDHRVVDGATAGRFLNEVIENLQSPGRLLL